MKLQKLNLAVSVLTALMLAAGLVFVVSQPAQPQVMSASGYILRLEDGTGTVQLSVDDDGTLDVQGNKVDLDADADTSLTADTDDQIDVEVGGNDDFRFGADLFSALSGSNVAMNGGRIDLDADDDTSLTADTDDTVDFEVGGQDVVEITGSAATFQLDVYMQTPPVAKTSDYTATASESGALLSNAGAAGTIKLTLPSAVPGLGYCIYVAEAQTITVDIDDSDQILDLTDAAGDAIQNTGTVGDSVCLTALDTTEWANLQEVGTWSDVN